MCNDDGSQPSGEAIAILQPPLQAAQIDTLNLQDKHWKLIFTNPSRESRGTGNTEYECHLEGDGDTFPKDCQLCIQ